MAIAILVGLGVVLITVVTFIWRQKVAKVGADLERIYQVWTVDVMYTRTFLLQDAVNVGFYRSGVSTNLEEEMRASGRVNALCKALLAASDRSQGLDTTRLRYFLQVHSEHELIRDELLMALRVRGMEDHGLEGRMRRSAHALEANTAVPLLGLLQLRRAEKDYIIRHEDRYVNKFQQLYGTLIKPKNLRSDSMALDLLSKYRASFLELVALDRRIGVRDNSGLFARLNDNEKVCSERLDELLVLHADRSMGIERRIMVIYGISVLVLFAVTVLFVYPLSERLAAPIRSLTLTVRQYVASGFHRTPIMLGISDRDVEVMELAHNFSVLQDEIQRHLTNMKELVDTRTEELARERDKVRAKNKEITDSLRYARGLQETMLTSVSELQRVLPLSFVMSIPKDVVAGDFLWVRELEVNGRRRVLFALADCTGHGVPASLLTVMCHNALDDALEVLEEPLPCLLLDRVNEAFMEIAPSNEEQHLGDGMTIALCSYDPIDRSLVFAGSFQSIFLVDAGEIHRIDGDTVFLSVVSGERAGYFKDRYLQLDEGAMIYLLSDGFQDQFGGPSGRKMMRSRVAQLLLEASALETDAQGVFLTERFDDWKGSYEQVDDVLVLGIKVAPPPLSSSEKSSKE